MRLTYRTKRRLQHLGILALILTLIGALVWLCSVIWLERYVVYSRDGAKLDFELPAQSIGGVVATPPAAQNSVSIYYNEGTDAVDSVKEMTQLNGYYISYDALSKDIEGVFNDLKHVKAGTPVMIELKGGYGSFYYSTGLSGAALSQSVSITRVDELIQELRIRGYYTIAKVSAFQDYDFGNKNVTCGLYVRSRVGLWPDPEGYFWLNPTSPSTLQWVTSVVKELKGMGFNEVLLSNFRFPAQTDKYIFNGDMDAAIQEAAKTINDACASETFVLSFGVAGPNFPLPEGRTRMFFERVEASNVSNIMSQVTIENPEVRVVFTGSTNDTRLDDYSVLRPVNLAELLEAQKADIAAMEEELGEE